MPLPNKMKVFIQQKRKESHEPLAKAALAFKFVLKIQMFGT